MHTLDEVSVSAYTIPTETPESDGTLAWAETTLVLVKAQSGEITGYGYTYADVSSAVLIREKLADAVKGMTVMDIPTIWHSLIARLRNLGPVGPGAAAVSAIDNALWDLKAKIFGVPLVELLGRARDAMPIYGSGGFTSYSDHQLCEQLAGWASEGIPRVKMKVGRNPEHDLKRVKLAREAIGDATELFVDANSAYHFKQALYYIQCFAEEADVRWMEQPLPPSDHDKLRFLREHSPAPLEIADGEYGYELSYFRNLLLDEAVDVVMADATRCCGLTGFLKVGALCDAWDMPFSSHCAPLQHLHAACAVPALRHGEYFYDHVRIERLLFEGLPSSRGGTLTPDLSRPGAGFELKHSQAESYQVF